VEVTEVYPDTCFNIGAGIVPASYGQANCLGTRLQVRRSVAVKARVEDEVSNVKSAVSHQSVIVNDAVAVMSQPAEVKIKILPKERDALTRTGLLT
jgi:hypothetical protein